MSSQGPQQTSTDVHHAYTPPESPPKHSPTPHLPSTPPQPDVLSPPSTTSAKSHTALPPPVEQVLKLIRDLFEGALPGDSGQSWMIVRLSPAEIGELEDALEQEKQLYAWVQDKLRFDYDSQRRGGEFVLRMPSPVHCQFTYHLSNEINQALKTLLGRFGENGHNVKLRGVLENIVCSSTSDVYFPGTLAPGKEKKSPDSSFRFDGRKYPPFIIEVANSQKSKALPRLAEDYIVRSDGETRTVLTVDLEYRSPKQRASTTPSFGSLRAATYSIYRYRSYERNGDHVDTIDTDSENQHFRSQNGQACDGSLELRLSDFCPPEALDGLHDLSLNISHEKLASLLVQAERSEHQATGEPTSTNTRPRNWILKRRRSPTPALTAEDEAIQKALEDEGEQRAENDDSSYQADSSFESQPEAMLMPTRPKRLRTAVKPLATGEA